MSAVAADTHSLIWYLDSPGNLSVTALAALRRAESAGDSIYISAISIVEIVYLVEKARLPAAALVSVTRAVQDPGSAVVVVPLEAHVASAVQLIPRSMVPDMPDRIIAATALHVGVPLVTRDARIRASTIATIW